ncbi:MAG: hypothetical protein WCK53_08540 [Methanomicrobiales archaeon]
MKFSAMMRGRADIVVTPGVGFGRWNEGYVRFAPPCQMNASSKHSAGCGGSEHATPPHLSVHGGHLVIGQHDLMPLRRNTGPRG